MNFMRTACRYARRLSSAANAPPKDGAAAALLHGDRPRVNEAGIQMLSPGLHAQLFPDAPKDAAAPTRADSERMHLAKEHLSANSIPFRESRPVQAAPAVDLPPLLDLHPAAGARRRPAIERHFWALGDAVSRPYHALAATFAAGSAPASAAVLGAHWALAPGWTRYALDTGACLGAVETPGPGALVLDVETAPSVGPQPLIAVALSLDALYVWLSPLVLAPAAPGCASLATPKDGETVALAALDSTECPSDGDSNDLTGANANNGLGKRHVPADSVSSNLYRCTGRDVAAGGILDQGCSANDSRDASSRGTMEGACTLAVGADPGRVDGSTQESSLSREAVPSLQTDAQARSEDHALVPMYEGSDATLVIGHHVSYDRARIAGEYSLARGPRRFLDTLSMHCAVAGLSSQQRIQWSAYRRTRDCAEGGAALKVMPGTLDDVMPGTLDDVMPGTLEDAFGDAPGECAEAAPWMERSAMNNLSDAMRLHLGRGLDKSPRDILVKGTLAEVREALPTLITYCANDVLGTAALFRALWPKFARKCPHPATLAAVLEMGTCFLPVTRAWPRYVAAVEAAHADAVRRTHALLVALVEETVAQGLQPSGDGGRPRWMDDPWLSKLDWTPAPARYTKARMLADGRTYAKGGEPRPIGNTALFGKPAWYRKLVRAGAVEITPRTRVLPYVLRMSWAGRPVHFVADRGWCRQSLPGDADYGRAAPDPLLGLPDVRFARIPHEDREDANVGSLMTRHHLRLYERGVLATPGDVLRHVLHANTAFSFWTGYRERVREQYVRWLPAPGRVSAFPATVSESAPPAEANRSSTAPCAETPSAEQPARPLCAVPHSDTAPDSEEGTGIILPGIITMGTVTRRAVEPTWMTASNAKRTLAGSELKALIAAPPGHVFVGADVDSQELWIASLLGDAQFGLPGATAMGWMTLQGQKADGTDLHSRTAAILGISRDDAKIFTYGRIYGAGVRYAAQLLQRFNPAMTADAALERARDLYARTKGEKRVVRVPPAKSDEHREHTLFRPGASARLYAGGTETFMFNVLEQIASADASRTPALGCEISDALLAGNVADDFLTSRVNWAVQSSGVDYLHMLVAAMAHLVRRHAIAARLALTIHDEIRYLVAEPDRYRAALALQVANAWTRSMFASRAGMADLPLGVVFFSAVDFDHVLRKDATADCVTPTNPTPVPPGEALDIYALLRRCPGGLGPVVHPDPAEYVPERPFDASVVLYRAPPALLRAQMDDKRADAPAAGDAPLPNAHSRDFRRERGERPAVARSGPTTHAKTQVAGSVQQRGQRRTLDAWNRLSEAQHMSTVPDAVFA